MSKVTASNDKWRRRSRQEWQTVFARFAKSGLGVEPFCVREGLRESTFRCWCSVLGDEVPPVARPAGARGQATLIG
ncbi:IS66 family insertion sequence element accessory protein TnpA [Thauera humireducens]|uniref:IS66 family insertion sequence element accessory protein TnpA n=1 Tax=Thauera humireducens TaxID=1134435 RepID=UPI00387FA5BC